MIESLFQPSTGNITPNSLLGVWANTSVENNVRTELRFRFTATSATLAGRCQYLTTGKSDIVGVTVAARVSNTEIKLLESKTDVKQNCQVYLSPTTLLRCGFDRENRKGCFDYSELSGTLVIFETDSTLNRTYNKIRD